MINYDKLPEHIRPGMRGYIEKGWRTGDFLTAVLSNDLMKAIAKADDINRDRIFDICSFLYNEAPAGCYGSPDRFNAWIESGGTDA